MARFPTLYRCNLIKGIKLHAEVKQLPLPASPALQPALIIAPTDWINTLEDAGVMEPGGGDMAQSVQR